MSMDLKLIYINAKGFQKKIAFLRYLIFENSYSIYSSFAFMIFINIVILISLFLDYF